MKRFTPLEEALTYLEMARDNERLPRGLRSASEDYRKRAQEWLEVARKQEGK